MLAESVGSACTTLLTTISPWPFGRLFIIPIAYNSSQHPVSESQPALAHEPNCSDHQDLGGRECDGVASSGGAAGMCGAERQDHPGEGRQCGGVSAGSQLLKSRRLWGHRELQPECLGPVWTMRFLSPEGGWEGCGLKGALGGLMAYLVNRG